MGSTVLDKEAKMTDDGKLTLDALWGKLANTEDLSALATLVSDGIDGAPTSDIRDTLRALAEQLSTMAIHTDLAPTLTVLGDAELDALQRTSAFLAQAVEREVLRRATALLVVGETGPGRD